jgi:hypothetical protein
VAATEPAALVIRSVVSGLDRSALAGLADVTVVGTRRGGMEIETPRYDRFTHILGDVARRGGTVREIAGNDDIMVTVLVPAHADSRPSHGRVICGRAAKGSRLIVCSSTSRSQNSRRSSMPIRLVIRASSMSSITRR